MFLFLRYLRHNSPKIFSPIWFFFGSFFRLFINCLKLNLYVTQHISKYGPFKIHCYFGFSNFEKWGTEKNSVFNQMINQSKNKLHIIDIGAHIGLTTLPLSKVINKNGKVYSFEPSNINYNYLNNHLKINKINNVKTMKTVVGERNKSSVLFYESQIPTGMNSIINIEKRKIKFKTTKKKQISLDSFIMKKEIKPDVIKIDAEGSEFFILKGGFRSIKKYRPLIFLSMHLSHMTKLNLKEKDFFDLFSKINYRLKDSSGKKCLVLESKEYILYPK